MRRKTNNQRRLDRRRDDFFLCLETIRCMVDMVGIASDGTLYNPYTGEMLDADNEHSTFVDALMHGGPCEEIIADVAKYHYMESWRGKL